MRTVCRNAIGQCCAVLGHLDNDLARKHTRVTVETDTLGGGSAVTVRTLVLTYIVLEVRKLGEVVVEVRICTEVVVGFLISSA